MLDTIIGLAFDYLLFSLVATSLQELLASALHLRAQFLRKGIETLVGCLIAKDLYAHRLVAGLEDLRPTDGDRLADPAAKGKRRISYLPAHLFALALQNVVGGRGDDQLLRVIDGLEVQSTA